jgi:hypothetical protein
LNRRQAVEALQPTSQILNTSPRKIAAPGTSSYCPSISTHDGSTVTRPLIVVAAFLCLAVPAALAAPPADKGKPEKEKNKQEQTAAAQASEDNGAKKCKAERAAGTAAFKAKYGSNGLGKCVSGQKQKSKEDKAKDDDENEAEEKAEDNAAKKCKAERASIGVEAFKNSYGTNHNKANAFGKCVSKLAKAQTS